MRICGVCCIVCKSDFKSLLQRVHILKLNINYIEYMLLQNKIFSYDWNKENDTVSSAVTQLKSFVETNTVLTNTPPTKSYTWGEKLSQKKM